MMRLDSKQFEFLWKREASLPYGYSVLPAGWNWILQDLGENTVIHAENRNGLCAAFMLRGVIARYMEKVIARVEKRSPVFERQVEELHATGQAYVRFSEGLMRPQNLSLSELVSRYVEFFRWMERYGVHLWRIFYLAEAVGKVFEKVFLPKCGSPEEFQRLVRPNKKAAPYVLVDLFRKEPDVRKRLKIFKEQFRFLTVIDPFWPSYSDAQLEDYVRAFLVPEESPPLVFSDLTDYEQWLLSLYQNLLYVKDRRDDYRRIAFSHVRPLIDEIARRLEITAFDLSLLFVSEVADFDKNRSLLMEEIAKRREGYVIEYTDGEKLVLSGREAVKNFFEQGVDSSIRELRGVPGSSGKVVGRVQILLSTRDVSSFQAGNILVAISTNSPYLPAMQKALAFVTDEGGVTAHAAILARELGKPAVVGTKIATKVLRDGERVEVDGAKGVVRKLG